MIAETESEPSVVSFDYAKEAEQVKKVLREEFPHAGLSMSEGWRGRVHVKIVSEFFDGKTEADKQKIVWDALDARLGAKAEAVSLVLAYGMDEI